MANVIELINHVLIPGEYKVQVQKVSTRYVWAPDTMTTEGRCPKTLDCSSCSAMGPVW